MESLICTACPRACGARRTSAENRGGRCGMPAGYRVARAALHHWEEPCLSGANGSGTVFFTGCSLGCVYCQNYSVSTGGLGLPVSEERLLEIFYELVEAGAHNINLVNPTHYAPQLAQTLRRFASPVPVVYNSSGYESIATLRALEGLVDIYLPDLKYARSDIAGRYSAAADYPEVSRRAVLEMVRQAGAPVYDDSGLMLGGVLVRHLILPGNIKNSLEVLDWIAAHLPEDVPLSLMSQYTPCGRAWDYPEVSRRLTRREYDKVAGHLLALGREAGYVQELSGASEEYIPPFDFTGVLPG